MLLMLLASVSSAERPVVILLSWDGVRHDYLDRAEFPGLGRIENDGLRAERLIPIFPSSTFPNHTALATGTYADRHGIVDNVFRDGERGVYDYSNDGAWIDAEPLWVTAERQGVRAAVFFWVGSETDWHGIGATYRRAPFDSDVDEGEKVDQILAWLDLPVEQRPGLIMMWWRGADRVGHTKGPDHPDIAIELRKQDDHLARLLAGIDRREGWGHTTLLIVSDHGMTEVSKAIEVREPLERAGIAADVLGGTAVVRVYLEDPKQRDAAYRVLKPLSNAKVYTAETIPDALRVKHPSRNGDLMLVTTPPHTFRRRGRVRAAVSWLGSLFTDSKTGGHGYAPDHPDMGAVFLGMGRGLPRGVRIGPVRNIDIAPTIAVLLGIDPPAHAEGRAIGELDRTARVVSESVAPCER
jgi:predicted AlkP superfamily pyrophosphatase or phosphodiesterase